MSDNETSGFVEIQQMMRDKRHVQNDFNEMYQVIGNMFKDKYLTKLTNELEKQNKKVQNNPSKEVALLSTMKLFMPEEQHGQVEQMISMLNTLNTLNNIQNEMHSGHGYSTAENNQQREHYHNQSNEHVDNKYANPFNSPQGSNRPTPSIYEDGVYDIDKACLRNKSGYPGGGYGQGSSNGNMNGMMQFMMLLTMLRR